VATKRFERRLVAAFFVKMGVGDLNEDKTETIIKLEHYGNKKKTS
jgi:hypothetical protein